MRRFCISLRGVLAAGVGVGTLLFAYSCFIPGYLDPARASALRAADWTAAADLDAFTQDWFRQMDEVRTAKWDIQDFGVGLFTLSLTLLLAARFFGVRELTQIRRMNTPRTMHGFLIPGTIAWLGTTVSYVYVLFRNFSRDYYPSWADSIAIPLTAVPGPLLLLPIPLVLGWLILRRATLSVNLWIWNSARPLRSWSWAFFFSALCLLLGLFLLGAILNGDFILVPLALTGLYLCLSARAAITA